MYGVAFYEYYSLPRGSVVTRPGHYPTPLNPLEHTTLFSLKGTCLVRSQVKRLYYYYFIERKLFTSDPSRVLALNRPVDPPAPDSNFSDLLVLVLRIDSTQRNDYDHDRGHRQIMQSSVVGLQC